MNKSEALMWAILNSDVPLTSREAAAQTGVKIKTASVAVTNLVQAHKIAHVGFRGQARLFHRPEGPPPEPPPPALVKPRLDKVVSLLEYEIRQLERTLAAKRDNLKFVQFLQSAPEEVLRDL